MTIAFGGAYFRALAVAGFLLIGVAAPAGMAAAQGFSGAAGGAERRAIIQGLSAEEKQKFFAMSPAEKQKFFKQRVEKQGGGHGGPPAGRGRPPPLVELATVELASLVQIFPITGRLVPRQQGAIAARIKGRVARVLVQVGERVKKGQILAELSRDRLKLEVELRDAEVNQARARLKSAKAQVAYLNQEVKRLEGLRRSAAFSQARYEDKRQEVVKARAAVEETAAALSKAMATRDLARIDLSDSAIRAPFSGAVIIRHVSAGAYINAGTPVVTLLNNQSLEIEADVPSDKLDGMRPGDMITVRLGGKIKITARLRAIIPDENPLSRTRAVRLTPSHAAREKVLVANQSVVIEVPSGNGRKVVSIPKDAVVNRRNKKIVFLFENGSVRPVHIQIGKSFAGKFEVRSGLEAGQIIVVTGNELLRPGQRVRVKRGAPAQSPAPAQTQGQVGDGRRQAVLRSMSPGERQEFLQMSPAEKQKFMERKWPAKGKPKT